MANKILEKSNTSILVGKFNSSHLEQLIKVLSKKLKIPFIGLETLDPKKINDGLALKGEYLFISQYSGFDANQIHFRTKKTEQNQYIKIEIEPNSYFINGHYDEKLEEAYLKIKKLNLN